MRWLSRIFQWAPDDPPKVTRLLFDISVDDIIEQMKDANAHVRAIEIRQQLAREKPMRDFLASCPARPPLMIYESDYDRQLRRAKERRNIAKSMAKRRHAMKRQDVEFDFPTTAIENSMRHEWERPLRNGAPVGSVAKALVNSAHDAFNLTPSDLFDHIRARRKGPHDLVVSIPIRCTEAQFARFMIARNNYGGCNTMKELAPRYIPAPPAVEPPRFIDVR